MSHYTKQDILQMVEEEDVEFIRLQFTDIFGNRYFCHCDPPSFFSNNKPIDG